MYYELELTKTNRLKIANAFHIVPRVDMSIDCVIEGQMGQALVDGKTVGVAYSSLVCSRGIEVSIFVDAAHRRQGMATTLGSKLLLACLQRGLHPNWDAANPESVTVAEKLGYQRTSSYEAYFHRHNS